MGELKLNKNRSKRHLTCNEEVYELIIKKCIKTYLRHHPEMRGAKISQNHILKQIGEFYSKDD